MGTTKAFVNKPPVAVYTVDDSTVTLPDNEVILDLSASYDPNWPQKDRLKFAHSKTLGPDCTFENATAAITKVILSTAGKYIFEGTVTDPMDASSSGTVTIEVLPALNKAPVVIYTVDKNQVTEPDNVVTLNLDASYDPEGIPLKYYLHKTIASPAVTFENANAAVTKATLSEPGMYEFRGIVKDNAGSIGRGTLNVELKEKPNEAPVAIYSAGKNALTAPENEVELDLSTSYDPDDKPLKSYNHVLVDGPACTIATPNLVNTKVTLTTPGKYIFEGTVEDDKGVKTNSTVTVELAQQVYITLFGCKFQDITKTQILDVFKKFEMLVYRPNGETVKGYPASFTNYKYFYDQGLKLVVNFAWERVQSGVIRTYPTAAELNEYEDKLSQIFEANEGGKYFAVAICENEPTNDGYFGDAPIENYIEELRRFASVCKRYGVECADGCTHIGYLKILMDNGGEVPKEFPGGLEPKLAQNELKNVAQVKAIITAVAGMPDITYSNFHHELNAGTPKNLIYNAATYLQSVTKKRLIANEFSMDHVSQAVLQNTVDEMRQLNLKYAVIWGGDGWPGEPPIAPSERELNDIIWKLGLRHANSNDIEKAESPGDAINIGIDVTTVGDWYRKAAKFIVKESRF